MNEPKTLTGLAIGDALGVPFETHLNTSPALQAWDGSFRDSEGLNTRQPERLAGEWSDDTKMAMALAQSLVDNGTYSPVDAASKYLEWYLSGDHRGIGKTTKEAMDRMLKGHHWNSSGIPHAEGNGTAMRAASLGLYYRKNLLVVTDMARLDASLTHKSIEAAEGSAAVALGVALLVEKVVDRSNFLKPVLDWIDEGSGIHHKLKVVKDFLETNATSGYQDLIRKSLIKLNEMGTKAHVLQTVPAAFLCFSVTNSFQDAVELAIRAGGDCDTTAAITGAFAGSFYGDDGVSSYLNQLEESSYLQHLDHVLYTLGGSIVED